MGMSIGTLMAYTLVAASVMILRYKPAECDEKIEKDYGSPTFFSKEYFSTTSKVPTERTSAVVGNCAALFGVVSVFHGFLLNKFLKAFGVESGMVQTLAFIIP